jgi:hypothetical protein
VRSLLFGFSGPLRKNASKNQSVAACDHNNGGYMKSKEIFSTVFAKAKDLANEMTLYNTRVKRLVKQKKIEKEHVDNNRAVRKMLHERGIDGSNRK